MIVSLMSEFAESHTKLIIGHSYDGPTVEIQVTKGDWGAGSAGTFTKTARLVHPGLAQFLKEIGEATGSVARSPRQAVYEIGTLEDESGRASRFLVHMTSEHASAVEIGIVNDLSTHSCASYISTDDAAILSDRLTDAAQRQGSRVP